MSLTNSMRDRIRVWLEELPRHFYQEIGEVEFEAFATRDRLSPEAASAGAFAPYPAGTSWGAKWEYGWFRAVLRLPEEAAGRRIVLVPDFGCEALVFVDGAAAGAVDKKHKEILLSRAAAADAEYRILAEAYAGHGPREETVGPVPPGRVPVPEPGATQAVVGRSTFGSWDDLAYALWMDATTLFQLRESLSEGSLRRSEIDEALTRFTRTVDFELDDAGRAASFAAGREVLKPLLECRNGSTAPTMHVFGNSHLDIAWLWHFAETERKSARTMSTQLELLDEYPTYRYFLCQTPLLTALRDGYPELWRRVKEKVKEGRIDIDGAMWLESDTNLPSGESLIRQFLYGIRFSQEEFGIEPEVLWLPDSFGFSAALPQIMAGCGIRNFATVKLLNTYSGGEPFPWVHFDWVGLDGSTVAAAVFRKSNSDIDPATLIRRWEHDRLQKNGVKSYLFPFGYGDGGGGPTRTHLEFVARMADLEGVPRTRMSSPAEFFRALEADGPTGVEWVGELYFSEHRGTYTTQAATKKANRRAESALRRAELWASLAAATAGRAYPREEMERLWKLVLFNHFHDIVSGASIERVHAEAVASYGQAIEGCRAVESAAIDCLGASASGDSWGGVSAGAGTGFAAVNSLPWPRRALLRLPAGTADLRPSAGGECLPTQRFGDGVLAEVELPSCGWLALSPETASAGTGPGAADGAARARSSGGASWTLENPFLRAEIDSFGRLVAIVDREAGRDLAAGPCNELRLYKDVNPHYDAWDISEGYENLRLPVDSPARISILADGPLCAALSVERPIGAASAFRQEIRLSRFERRIEFRTEIDWREDHKLLKVAFPTAIHTDGALHEIQFGHLRRPNHRSTRFDAERFEVCNHRWSALAETRRGVALLNDGKYGVGTRGGELTLTLLKAPFVPDMRADRGRHEFAYSFYFWNGPFESSCVVRAGYEANEEPKFAPSLGSSRSFLSTDDPAVVAETVKSAEDGSGDLVVRLYESLGSVARCRLWIGFPVAAAASTDLLEQGRDELPVIPDGEGGASIELDFRAFQVRTVRLSRPRP